MKKLFVLFLCFIFLILYVCNSGCTSKYNGCISVYAPDGAPALSIAKFIDNKENFETNYDFNYNVVTPQNLGTKMVQGLADIIVMPINMASKLYNANKTDNYKMISVITHGNLYITSTHRLELNDLKNKVVGVIKQVPELTLKAILNANRIDYVVSDSPVTNKVALKEFNNGSEMIPLLRSKKIDIGLLPEPTISKLESLDNDYAFRLDVQNLYNNTTNSFPQAVLMVKNSLLVKFPDLINKIYNSFNENINWIKLNIESAINAVNLVLESGAVPSLNANTITLDVIENCKIYWQSCENSKVEVKKYINDIINIENTSAKSINEDFFGE